MNNFSTSDFAGWWGAIIATFVLIWDIYKWKNQKAKISFDLSTNMKMLNDPYNKNNVYLSIRVKNTGVKSTTLTNIGLLYYKSFFHKIINKTSAQFVAFNPIATHPLPYVIHPGNIWDGSIIQTEEIKKMAKDGYLICAIYFSNSKKPKTKLVKFKS